MRQTYSEHYQTFKMERFVKWVMNDCSCTTRKFSGQGFVELGHFD